MKRLINLKKILKNVYFYVILILIITFFSLTECNQKNVQKGNKINEIENLDFKFFLYNVVPDGFITSIIGITSTYDSLMINLPANQRFKYWHIGIYDKKNDISYRITVPHYAIYRFKLGKQFRDNKSKKYINPYQKRKKSNSPPLRMAKK